MDQKGPSDTSRGAPSRSRGGGKGRGTPLPEGEEGVFGRGKKDIVRPPAPRGLAGFSTNSRAWGSPEKRWSWSWPFPSSSFLLLLLLPPPAPLPHCLGPGRARGARSSVLLGAPDRSPSTASCPKPLSPRTAGGSAGGWIRPLDRPNPLAAAASAGLRLKAGQLLSGHSLGGRP